MVISLIPINTKDKIVAKFTFNIFSLDVLKRLFNIFTRFFYHLIHGLYLLFEFFPS